MNIFSAVSGGNLLNRWQKFGYLYVHYNRLQQSFASSSEYQAARGNASFRIGK
jgi:hypothetical protein